MPLIRMQAAGLDRDSFPLSFSAREGLSLNPEYVLEFQDPLANLDLEALLGKPVAVAIELPAGGVRHFSSYVISGFDHGHREDQYVYKLELRTWFWFLLQNHNCRIFQEMSVPQIVEKIFSKYDFANYRLDLQGAYPQREYCVQFRETDFQFVTRLLEDEGIYFYFEHGAEAHTMVLSDRQKNASLAAPYAQLHFMPDGEEQRAIREAVQRLQRSRHVQSEVIVLRDYNYFTPRNNLQTRAEKDTGGGSNIPLEWYDYSAGYRENARGEQFAKLRLEALQTHANTLSGESNAVGLETGKTFSLILHPDAQRNRAYKILNTDYVFLQDGPDSAAEGRNVSCRFIALNDDMVFRPRRLSLKPQVPGIQSATVVGPADSEVHTDQLSRIRVHFHWDRETSSEEDSSCWMRVAQSWTGKGWGIIAMPRVGQEVLVTYLDGDMDQPLVTGMVYNGDNTPPYDLPERINYSGLVSRSLKHGMPQHASQFTFDDARGAERVMIHAERDLQQTVERNAVQSVGQDAYMKVTRTSTATAENHLTYATNKMKSVGNDVNIVDKSFSAISNVVNVIQDIVSQVDSSVKYTAESTSVTGSSTSYTGKATNFTGMSTGTTGVATTFVGISTGTTGVATSFVGINTSTVGVATSTTGVNTSTVGVATSTTGVATSTTGVNTSTTGMATSTTGSSRSVTGMSNSTTGISISSTGVSISHTGVSITSSGSKTSSAGSESKTRGMQSKN